MAQRHDIMGLGHETMACYLSIFLSYQPGTVQSHSDNPLCLYKLNVHVSYLTSSYFTIRFLKDQPARSWWRHQMETLSALLALCAGNSPVTGEFPSQRPVTRSFNVFFDLRLNKRMSKLSRCRWLRRPRAHYDVTVMVADPDNRYFAPSRFTWRWRL